MHDTHTQSTHSDLTLSRDGVRISDLAEEHRAGKGLCGMHGGMQVSPPRDGGHAPLAHRAWHGDAQNEAKGAGRRHVLPRVPWLRSGARLLVVARF